MNRSQKKFVRVLAAALTLAFTVSALAAGSGTSDTQRRTITGAALGGAVVGIATGSAGWAAVGAVAGGTGGYLYDKNKKNEEKAYEKGVKEGQSSKSK